MGVLQLVSAWAMQMFRQTQVLQDRELERQRQERLDAQRIKKGDMCMGVLRGQQEDANLERAVRQQLRDMMSPTSVEQGYADVGTHGKVSESVSNESSKFVRTKSGGHMAGGGRWAGWGAAARRQALGDKFQ